MNARSPACFTICLCTCQRWDGNLEVKKVTVRSLNRCDRLLHLPFYSELIESDQARVVEAIKEFVF